MSKILDEKLEKMTESEQKLWALRHTAEHVLHTAVQNLYPKLKKAMGPATPEGFYTDFDLNEKITEDDFPKIEKEMQKLIGDNLPMVQENLQPEKARELFKNNPYKLEWIKEIEKRGEKYQHIGWVMRNSIFAAVRTSHQRVKLKHLSFYPSQELIGTAMKKIRC